MVVESVTSGVGACGADFLIGLHALESPRTTTVGGDGLAEVQRRASERLDKLLGGVPAVILTGSCTSALEVAAAGLDLAAGDEVIVPAFTFPSSVTPFLARGAVIRFADVSADTGNIDPSSVEDRLSERTKAVVLMHYAGMGADLGSLHQRLDDLGVDVVEDAAHGVFASLHGRPLGTIGRFGCLSFHRTKNLSTGDGGALVVNRDADVGRAMVAVDKGTNRVAFDAGLVDAYEWSGPGMAARMHEASVRLMEAELDAAADRQACRHAAWSTYALGLATWADEHDVKLPVVPVGAQHPAHQFHLVLPPEVDRRALMERWSAAGVQTAWHYGSLPYSTEGRRIALPDDACPVAADLARCLVRIPMHAQLSAGDVQRVIDVITSPW